MRTEERWKEVPSPAKLQIRKSGFIERLDCQDEQVQVRLFADGVGSLPLSRHVFCFGRSQSAKCKKASIDSYWIAIPKECSFILVISIEMVGVLTRPIVSIQLKRPTSSLELQFLTVKKLGTDLN